MQFSAPSSYKEILAHERVQALTQDERDQLTKNAGLIRKDEDWKAEDEKRLVIYTTSDAFVVATKPSLRCMVSIVFIRAYPTRNGCGRAIMQQVIKHCAEQGVKTIIVSLQQCLLKAGQFYDRLGFISEKTRKKSSEKVQWSLTITKPPPKRVDVDQRSALPFTRRLQIEASIASLKSQLREEQRRLRQIERECHAVTITKRKRTSTLLTRVTATFADPNIQKPPGMCPTLWRPYR